jgi:ankyrin repeat protein
MAVKKSRTTHGMRMAAALIAVLALWATVSHGKVGDLAYAAYYGEISQVKQLLAAGAQVNARDKNGVTPLMAASLEGHREIVEVLLASGAEVNARTTDGETALTFATRMKHQQVREALLKAGAN